MSTRLLQDLTHGHLGLFVTLIFARVPSSGWSIKLYMLKRWLIRLSLTWNRAITWAMLNHFGPCVIDEPSIGYINIAGAWTDTECMGGGPIRRSLLRNNILFFPGIGTHWTGCQFSMFISDSTLRGIWDKRGKLHWHTLTMIVISVFIWDATMVAECGILDKHRKLQTCAVVAPTDCLVRVICQTLV